ncbi:hypothetical protein [Niabella hirudinis]
MNLEILNAKVGIVTRQMHTFSYIRHLMLNRNVRNGFATVAKEVWTG